MQHEIYAVRYAHMGGRGVRDNFLFADPHNPASDLDFFVWLVRTDEGDILVDTGFNQSAAERRGRNLIVNPADALDRFGVDCGRIRHVVVTHLHYDHAGNLDRFPNAVFHVQAREMSFATGPCMCHRHMRHPFDVDDVAYLVRQVYGGRVMFHDGGGDVVPGVSLHRTGGHSEGLQVVRVATARGPVVLASDALHLYANMDLQNPFPIVSNVGQVYEGWRIVGALAGDRDRIIPGHDPQICTLYPSVEGFPHIFALHPSPTRRT